MTKSLPVVIARHLATAAWLLGFHLGSPTKFANAEAPCPIQLTDVSSRTGINFRHHDGSTGQRYIVETVASGLALFDYDGDGDVDIYFLNGANLRGSQGQKSYRNALYRNEGNWKFTDVTDAAGVGDDGHGLGVAVGDYDNDGHPDLFVSNFGPNVLYRNQGDGTFVDVTHPAGVASGNDVGAGACFLDFDNDGDLDLYVARYVDFTYDNHRTVRFNGHPAYVGPLDYEPTSDTLYRNNGDGTFSDVSIASGVASHRGTGMGVIACDYDDDGDIDVFVGNDMAGNFVLRNNGQGRFDEVGLLTGLAYDLSGKAQGTMGVGRGDVDNDGLIDLYVTSYQQELATLYKNLGHGVYSDVTNVTGAGQGTLAHVTWGCGVVDFDNDGFRDLFVACGHLHDNVASFDSTTSYQASNVVLRNLGNGHFDQVDSKCGSGLAIAKSSRGAAFDDLDNDGDLDVVILESRDQPTLLRNDSPAKHHWLQIQLRGTTGNRDGMGAKVKVVAGDLSLVGEAASGRGYQSHFGTRLHFGLKDHHLIDRVEVTWLGGKTQIVEAVPTNQVLTITEAK